MPRLKRNTSNAPTSSRERVLFWPRLLLLALVVSLLAWGMRGQMFSLDAALYDNGIVTKQPRDMDNIVIVGIDEAFMDGRHPYLAPRDLVAQLLQTIVAAKPRAVALDVYLDSRIDNNPRGVDAQLREALVAANQRGVPVVISDVAPLTGTQMGELKGKIAQGTNARGTVIDYFSEITPTGDASVDIAPDGVVRQLQPFGVLAPLSYLLASKTEPARDWETLRRRGQMEKILLDFHGPPGSIITIPAANILHQPVLASMLQDKIVFIGATYEQSRDLMLSPYSLRGDPPGIATHYRPFYGIELLATATQTLLDGAPRRSHEDFTAQTTDFLLLFIIAAAVVALARRGITFGLLAVAVVVLAAGAIAIFSAKVAPDNSALAGLLGHRFHPAGTFLLGAPLAATVGIAWKQLDQARELRQVRDAFGAYVGDEILEALGGRMPELGGEIRPLAVLFCDIRGYSALAEKMRDDPKTLMAELNAHFHPLVNALKVHGAYVDNYVGDLVMALFGAPAGSDLSVVARRAARAALDFVDLVEARNAKRREEGLPVIEIGVGVHCGDAVVGNLGSMHEKGSKIHYTAIGDTVNLASRVESSTRNYNVPLLITEEMVHACATGPQDDGIILPEWVFVAETTVKGRETPVRLYRPNN